MNFGTNKWSSTTFYLFSINNSMKMLLKVTLSQEKIGRSNKKWLWDICNTSEYVQ